MIRCGLMFLMISYSSFAGIKNDMMKFFNDIGLSSNVSSAGAYQDQMGGFYTGGSFVTRTRPLNTNLMNIQMPEMRMGCSGIDMFTGGFSFINSQQLIRTLRSIGSSAASYSFALALQTVTPQIKSVIDELSAKMQDINNMNINSCEAAATLVGGIWPKTEASNGLLCKSIGTNYGKFSDWADSRHKCGAGNQQESINSGKANTSFKDILQGEFNIAWQALQKSPFLSGQRGMAEFFMSISGSIVSKKSGNSYNYYPLKSLATSELLGALIDGIKPANIYKCPIGGDDKCIITESSPRQEISIGKGNALLEKISLLLQSMGYKIRNDGDISEEERSFVNSTTLPIFKMLAVEVAFRENGSPVNALRFTEAIAYDIILRYFDEIIEVVDSSISQIQYVQINDEIIREFKSNLYRTRKMLLRERSSIYQQIATTLKAVQHTHQTEQKLQSMFLNAGSVSDG
jgi:conjugative transfer pilus assembly protein TraH